MSPFELAAREHHSVWVQKFSATTYWPDAISAGISMRKVIDRANVGRIWCAKVGRQRRWWSGWTAEEALEKALKHA